MTIRPDGPGAPGDRPESSDRSRAPGPAIVPDALELLLVEDNPGDVDLLRAHLEDIEAPLPDLEVAGSLADALDLLDRRDFAAILLDLNLPDSRGIDTLDAVLSAAPETPVIVLTGVAGADTWIETVRRGAADFIPKDELSGRLLFRSVRYALERRRRRKVESRFQALVENARDLVTILGPDFRIRYVSPSIERILGFSPGERVGASALSEVHPEDRDRVAAEASRVMDDPSYVAHLQYRVRHRDGGWRVLDTIAENRLDHPNIRGVVVNSWDVTNLVETQAALRERMKEIETLYGISRELARSDQPLEERLRACVDLLPPGWMHPGVTEARIVYDDSTFTTAGFRESPWMLSREIETQGMVVGRVDVVLVEERPVKEVGPFLREEEELLEAVALAVGEAVERERLEREFVRAQKMEAVGRLSGGIAHDFNNLLTVIRAHADFLLMDLEEADPKTDEVETIRSAADQAADLTAQLLAFGREQLLRPQIVDANEVVRSTRRFVTRIIGEDVQIELELDEDVPPVEVDPAQLEQALLNLAVNARDAMPEGGTLTVGTAREEVAAEVAEGVPDLEPGSYVRLTVSDTGEGMDEETRSRIFEPFFSTKARGEGTGLGLAMVYGIVTQSGGAIQVDSEVGRGTTFLLRFPVAEGEPESVEVPVPADDEELDLTGRILVVEDDASVRRVACAILERAGFDVVAVGSAEEGLEQIHSNGGDFDALLTDLVLPGMNGRELLDRVRDQLPGIPLVAMSGYAEGSPGRRGELPREILFLQKPFTPEDLAKTVGRAVAGGRR